MRPLPESSTERRAWSQQDFVADTRLASKACKHVSFYAGYNMGLVFDNIGCEHCGTLTDFLL